jgi:hypothetical protein
MASQSLTQTQCLPTSASVDVAHMRRRSRIHFSSAFFAVTRS